MIIRAIRRADQAIHRVLWRVYLRDRYRRLAKRRGDVTHARHHLALDVAKALTWHEQDDLRSPAFKTKRRKKVGVQL
jgi:hypothetical protein